MQAKDWGTHQLSEFLASITTFEDEASALLGAIERTAEALEAEIGLVVRNGEVIASIGLCPDEPDVDVLLSARHAESAPVNTAIAGPCAVGTADLEDGAGTLIMLARAGGSAFDRAESILLSNMGRTLGLVLRMLRTLESERAALTRLEARQELLERLTRIQRSISHRAPLQEVLDSITEGLRQLTGDEVTGLRLVDPDDPRYLNLVSASGVDDRMMELVNRTGIDAGAGGVAYSERRLVVIEDYEDSESAIAEFARYGMQVAMGAPVHIDGEVAGSLVSASYVPGRTYSPEEQEMLVAMAEHASLALTDAKTLEAMREARRAKDLFLAMVSHELKTPLTVMMGTLHTLRSHGDALEGDTRDELITAGLVRGADLKRLIDMLLKGARGELAGAAQNVFLPALVRDSIKGFDTSKRVEPAIVPEIWTLVDPVAFHQIIGVLMENAITHSPDDATVTVEVSVVRSTLRVEVRNPGSLPLGLDRADLFKPFQRGEDVRAPGVGLGLYIAHQLAESIGGHLEADQRDGEVAFWLALPFTEGKARASRPDEDSALEERLP